MSIHVLKERVALWIQCLEMRLYLIRIKRYVQDIITRGQSLLWLSWVSYVLPKLHLVIWQTILWKDVFCKSCFLECINGLCVYSQHTEMKQLTWGWETGSDTDSKVWRNEKDLKEMATHTPKIVLFDKDVTGLLWTTLAWPLNSHRQFVTPALAGPPCPILHSATRDEVWDTV